MTGSVPSVKAVAVGIGDILRLHPGVPTEVLIETSGGSRITVDIPPGGHFEILRGHDISNVTVNARRPQQGLRMVEGTKS